MKFLKLFGKYTLAVSLVLLLSACEEGFLDVNEDPTTPNEVPENLQLSSLQGNFSYEVVANTPVRIGSQWIQQIAWTGFQPSSDNYDVDESDVNNVWNASYIDVLNNAKELEERALENGNNAYAGIAKVIIAWNMSIITDLWNEAPYSEAFDPLNTTPAYDSQENIYNTIFDLLDGALADFQAGGVQNPGSDDLLYGGDIESWERLTHTLIARYSMRLSNAPGYEASTQADAALAALANGFTSNADDADFQYFDVEGEENPWYQFAIDGKWDTRDQLSANYIALLESLNDPRLPIQARPAGAVDGNGLVDGFDPEEPEYVGHANGEEGPGAAAISSIGEFYSAPNAPLTWISFAEAKFIEAEATLITDGAAAAQQSYEEAIRASMEKLGVDAGDTDAYIASLPLLADAEDALEEIITQKYIANFINFEAYNDWRRTGYPEIEPAADPQTPSGIVPLRFPYPNSELQNNADNVDATGVPVGLSALEINVWWDSGN